jgi:drug/metabolite transporter (DMT)-like permease
MGLVPAVRGKRHDLLLAGSLLFAVFLWGGNNAGTRFIVQNWPPIWTGGSRFFCAGLVLLLVLRFTSWLGKPGVLTPATSWQLWWRGGLSLAVYIVIFNWALRLTTASHVALYLGAAPVWALVWEGVPHWSLDSLRRYGAAGLALAGIIILFWPALWNTTARWPGELLGLLASVLWTHYGRQCRALGVSLSGVEVSAHTMWRAGLLLLPLGFLEIYRSGFVWRMDVGLVQIYCILAGGVAAFAIWSSALRHWPVGKVLLFNNLIPLSTTGWASVWLNEKITPRFWASMALIVAGVVLGQTRWETLIGSRQVPPE